MNSRERTEAHYLKVAQKLKSGAEAKASSTQGTSQERSERHYLSIARKLKGSL
jgi:hypothetical protein